MVATIPFNPMVPTNAAGSFSIISDGYTQGDAQDDPSYRHWLDSGVLSDAETLPMIGGALIYSDISGGLQLPGVLGGTIGRAATIAAATGFSVLNQAFHGLTSPQNTAPVFVNKQTIHYYRFGSRARIPLAVDPALVSQLIGQPINTQVSWDFNSQRIVPFVPVTPAETITVATWAAGVATITTSAAHGYVAGDDIVITGVTPAGYNGSVTVVSVPTTTTLTYNLATNPGGAGTAFGQIGAGGGILPVKLLDLQASNSYVYAIDPVTGAYIWNRQGSTVLVEI